MVNGDSWVAGSRRGTNASASSNGFTGTDLQITETHPTSFSLSLRKETRLPACTFTSWR